MWRGWSLKCQSFLPGLWISGVRTREIWRYLNLTRTDRNGPRSGFLSRSMLTNARTNCVVNFQNEKTWFLLNAGPSWCSFLPTLFLWTEIPNINCICIWRRWPISPIPMIIIIVMIIILIQGDWISCIGLDWIGWDAPPWRKHMQIAGESACCCC